MLIQAGRFRFALRESPYSTACDCRSLASKGSQRDRNALSSVAYPDNASKWLYLVMEIIKKVIIP
jgi:hypothetical protein